MKMTRSSEMLVTTYKTTVGITISVRTSCLEYKTYEFRQQRNMGEGSFVFYATALSNDMIHEFLIGKDMEGRGLV